MILFEKVRWKNFLSTGNYYSEIDFCGSPTTLIIGQNGSGKSTMLDALSFGLFGKPHRKITKAQLINTINNKDCRVEVEFRVNSVQYKVVRGIKPTKFEIWKDGTMINQSSHAKEYQDILEKNVLQMSHKSFHQIVVLGSSSFVPFMQLATAARREVIEDLLDINIFSKMNAILKEKIALLKEEIRLNGHNAEIVKTKINSQKKYLRDITALTAAHLAEKRQAIAGAEAEIAQLQKESSTLSQTVEDSLPTIESRLSTIRKQSNDLRVYNDSFKAKAKTIAKEIQFFDNNEHCPSCEQPIDSSLRMQKKEDGKCKARELQEAMSKASEQQEVFAREEADLTAQYEEIRSLQSQIHVNNQAITRLQKTISDNQRDIDGFSDSAGDMAQANRDLEALNKELEGLQDQKYIINEQYSYQRICSELLRDTGIKTKIIKQYVPVINELTNKYLQVLDFFVHFELDESFNETIRSRYRDNFSYDSFSEGEKQRIDLSLLFTWRQIAKMKNSVSTNLLILDETFDSSLDGDGVDNLMKIIDTIKEDTNVFVISHKSELEDAHFNRKIVFYKEKNFSKMKDIS